MSPPPAPSQALFRQLVRETDESAAVALLVDLCRTSEPLRVWLFEEFGKDARVRAKFARELTAPKSPVVRFTELAGTDTAWREETRLLRERFAQHSYGGLSLEQLQELIARHQAGHGDPAGYLVAVEWRRCTGSAPPPRLVRATCALVAASTGPAGTQGLRDLARAIELTEAFADRTQLRAALGFTDWWKLSVLLYMLRHPAPSYRTRDLHRHLVSAGLNVSPRALRQFCTENGIARDQRAGRPRPASSGEGRVRPKRADVVRRSGQR